MQILQSVEKNMGTYRRMMLMETGETVKHSHRVLCHDHLKSEPKYENRNGCHGQPEALSDIKG